MSERHFFLNHNRKTLYCVENLPTQAKNKKIGIILCKPIWGERIRTHRIYANLARMLADEGFAVITCDYFGDGNSGGDTIDLSFESMVDDIRILYDHFVETNRFESTGMMGLLIGANVSIAVEQFMLDLETMLLFEPLLKPIEVFKRALRANLSSQMVKYKKIVKNRDELIADLRKDLPVNIDGFLIGKTFWESFERATPLSIKSNFKGKVNVHSMIEKGRKGVNFQNLAGEYKNGKFRSIEKEFVWTDWKYYIPKPPIFFETVKNGFCQK